MFCPACGHQNPAVARFCEECGAAADAAPAVSAGVAPPALPTQFRAAARPVSPPAPQFVAATPPAPPARPFAPTPPTYADAVPRSRRLAATLYAFVALLLIASATVAVLLFKPFGLFAGTMASQSQPFRTPVANAPATPESTANDVASPQPPGPTAPVQGAPVTLDDFAGTWVVMNESGTYDTDQDPNAGTLAFWRSNDQLLGRASGGTMQLNVLNGAKLSGTFFADKDAIPMTVELSQDKQQITIVLAPPASEYIVAVAWRQK